MVDSQGLVIGVLVTEANGSERLGAVVILHQAVEKLSKLEVVWVSLGYSGKNFAQAVKQICGDSVRVEVIERKSCIIGNFTKAMDRGANIWLVKPI